MNTPKKSSSSVQVFYPKFSKEEIIQAIGKNVENLKRELPLLLVVLFGSYAKGNYTVASDVDLLVIYEGEEKNEAYAIVKRVLNIPHLEPHIYPEYEFKEIKDTVKNMIKDGIILYQGRVSLSKENSFKCKDKDAK